MTKQRETWYYIKDGGLYRHSENDSYRLMRRGLEEEDEFIMTVEEAKEKEPIILKWANYDE